MNSKENRQAYQSELTGSVPTSDDQVTLIFGCNYFFFNISN